MSATHPSQIARLSWRHSLIGLLGAFALSLSACGSSPSSTLTAEVAPQPSTEAESVALLLRRKHPGEFDAEGFIARWDSALAQLEDPGPRASLTLRDLVTFGSTLAYSLSFALETVTLAESLGSYALLINQARPDGVDATELEGILAAATLLEQEITALSQQLTRAQQVLGNRPTPTDPALAQSLTDLQNILAQTQASIVQIQTSLIDELDVILADDLFTSGEAFLLSGAATVQAGSVLAQAGIYGSIYNDQVNFCSGLDSLLSILCAFLPSLTPAPSPSPIPSPSPSPSPSPLGTPLPNP